MQLTIQAPWLALPPITLTDLNRPIRTTDPLRGADAPWGEVMLYTSAYGGDVTAPALSTVLVLDDVALPSRGQVETTVRERFVPSVDRTFSIPEGTQLLVAHGSRAEELRPVTVGTLLSVAVEITPFLSAPEAWDGLRAALPGGGLLLKDGQVSSGTTLASEALDHASSRRARTAVGWTPAGQVLLLTVDETLGSRGLTLFETALVFRELGAIDAVALDGGGSTHLMIDGVTYNRPSGPGRGHSSAPVLYTEPPPPARDLVSARPPGAAPPAGLCSGRLLALRSSSACASVTMRAAAGPPAPSPNANAPASIACASRFISSSFPECPLPNRWASRCPGGPIGTPLVERPASR